MNIKKALICFSVSLSSLLMGSCGNTVKKKGKIFFDRQSDFVEFLEVSNLHLKAERVTKVMFMPPNFCAACLVSAGKIIEEQCDINSDHDFVILHSQLQECIGTILNCKNILCLPFDGQKARSNGLIDPYPILVTFEGGKIIDYLAII
jgi:hypothetical protein